jgi:hypothetical protein
MDGEITDASRAALAKMRQAVDSARAITFDCAGIRNINSPGVRVWLDEIRQLRTDIEIEFEKCSTYFVDYVNLLPDIINGGKVVSFDAPVHCATCKASRTVQLNAAVAARAGGFGEHRCPKCGSVMEPEVRPEEYLNFLLS